MKIMHKSIPFLFFLFLFNSLYSQHCKRLKNKYWKLDKKEHKTGDTLTLTISNTSGYLFMYFPIKAKESFYTKNNVPLNITDSNNSDNSISIYPGEQLVVKSIFTKGVNDYFHLLQIESLKNSKRNYCRAIRGRITVSQ